MESKTSSRVEELASFRRSGAHSKAVAEGTAYGAGAKERSKGTAPFLGAKIAMRAEVAPSKNVATILRNTTREQSCVISELNSEEEERQVEEEWERLKNKKKNEGEIRINSNPMARKILKGFRINYMRMRDAKTGEDKWKSDNWSKTMFETETVAHVPSSILQCCSVAREINFTSEEQMEDFRLEQRVFFQGVCIEEWFFKFGFVIPGSTNSWEQTIYAAEKSAMLPAHLLSGNITIETSFFDNELFISKSLVRVYYDAPEF